MSTQGRRFHGPPVVALFPFLFRRNDHLGPRIHASQNPGAWTLGYGPQFFKGGHRIDRNVTMAAPFWSWRR